MREQELIFPGLDETRGGKGILPGADVREVKRRPQAHGLGKSHTAIHFSTRPQ